MKYLFCIFSILWSIFSFSQEIQFTETEKQWIKDHPVINYGYEPRWEPYEIYKSGKYGGIVGDYVKILEQKTGIKMVPIPNLTWKKSMQGLMNGSIMVAPSFVNTQKRSKKFKLTKPYIVDPIVIVSKDISPYFSTINDLKGKTIALPANYYTNYLIKKKYPKIKIKNYNTVEDCFKALISKDVDAFVGNLNVVSYYRNNFGFSDLKIVGVTPFNNNGICLAVNPKWITFRDIADKVFENITPRQEHEIRRKWIGINEKQYLNSSFFKWTIIILSIALIIVVLIYMRNKSLKKGIEEGRETAENLNRELTISEKETNEKKAMLQEIHHRIKNNLQMVSSMLNLQANTINQEATSQVLKNAANRVNSIALIHNKIYASNNTKTVNLKDYIQSIFQNIHTDYQDEKEIKLEIKSDDINAPMKTIIPIALIINELLTNSLIHAFKNQESPEILIDIKYDSNKDVIITYSDNGTWVENKDTDQFGSSLINIFTEQIEGTYELIKKEKGTTYHFHLKI